MVGVWFKSNKIPLFLFIALIMLKSAAMAATPTFTPTPIPPEIIYTTFFGGNGDDQVNDMFIDANGFIYLVGQTLSSNLPVTNALDPVPGGVDQEGFVVKLTSDGKSIVYCTYFGGTDYDAVIGITVDGAGNAYITGATFSDAVTEGFFPTSGAMDTTLDGGRDAFVAKIDPNGNLLYCTYVGGADWDYGYCIALNDLEADTVHIGGFTHGSFPVTAGAAQTVFGGLGDAYVAKINLGTTTLAYATYLGGVYWEPAEAISVINGIAYVAGHTQSPNFPTTAGALDTQNNVPGANQGGDGFFTKLSADGSILLYSTFIGPENSPQTSAFNTMAIDSSGNVYLTGSTNETGWVTTGNAAQPAFGGGAQDGLMVKLNSDYTAITYCTYLGGTGDEVVTGITLDALGTYWLAGYTDSTGFPSGTTEHGGRDAFMLRLDDTDQIFWSDRLGGSGEEASSGQNIKVRLNATNNSIVLGGSTASGDLVTTSDALQPGYGGGTLDAFIIILASPSPTVTVSPTVTASPTPIPLTDIVGAAVPNPFLPALGQILNFNLKVQYPAGGYTCTIYNIEGKIVRTLNNTDEWDGRSQNGRYCEGGIYFYQVRAGKEIFNGKFVLIK